MVRGLPGRSGRSGRTVGLVEQPHPPAGPSPVSGQAQPDTAGVADDLGRDVDEPSAQGLPASAGMGAAGQGRGGAQQVVRDRGAGQPGAVGGEPTLGYLEFTS